LVYMVLNLLFVQGFSGVNVDTTKSALVHMFGNDTAVATSALFAYMVGSAGASSSDAGGVYQLGFVLVVSLAVIWVLREIYSGRQVKRIREAFYNGMTPLVPFVLVLIVFGLQLLPLIFGSAIYSAVMANGVAITGIERSFWLLML